MRTMRGVMSAEMPGTGGRAEFLWGPPASYIGRGCTGCGICFYCCPEPGAVTVYRTRAKPKPLAAALAQGGLHAATV